MNKKGTKALASATLMSLVLTTALATGNVKAAANGQATRVGGTDRYETAAKVATANFTTSENVVLVSGEGYADSVSASVLAKKLNAPIVLTGSKTLDANAKSAIETLKAKNVYIIGGTGSISASIETGLKSDYTVTRLGGQDRYATNLAIANKLVDLGVSKSNIIAVAGTGFADALSVAPVAAADNEILLLTNNNADTMKNTAEFAKDSNVTVVGTTNVVSDSIYNQLKADKRINGGDTRFETNINVLNAFDSDLKADKLYVANATQANPDNLYADALVASAIAGKYSAPLVLVDKETSTGTTNAINYIGTKATKNTDLQVVGGTGVISDATVTAIENAIKDKDTDPEVSSITANGLRQISVKFNQKVDSDTAEDVSNYKVDGTQLTASTAQASLQDDGETVIINLSSKQKQYDKVDVTVRKGIFNEDKSKTVPEYTQSVTFSDTEIPTVNSVEARGNDKITVKFSEPINIGAGLVSDIDDGDAEISGLSTFLSKFKIDGQNITNFGLNSDYSLAKNTVSDGTNLYSDEIEFYFNTALTTGSKTFKISDGVDNGVLSDAAGFSFQETSKDINIDTLTSKPQIKSITASDNKVYINFDRAMDSNTAQNKSNYEVNDTDGLVTKAELKNDDTQVKLTVSKLNKGSNKVYISDKVKDAYGNKVDNDTYKSFDLDQDDTKPAVNSVSVLNDSTIRVRFNKNVDASYAVDTSNYKLKDNDGTDISNYINAASTATDYQDGKTDAITIPGNTVAPDPGDTTDVVDIHLSKDGSAKYKLTDSKYTITIKNIQDTASTPNVMDDYVTTINGSDEVSPEVVGNAVGLEDSNFDSTNPYRKVVVSFNKAMDASSLTNTDNYKFKNDNNTVKLPSGTTIDTSSDNKSAIIAFPSAYGTQGKTGDNLIKSIAVIGVKDTNGNALAVSQTVDVVPADPADYSTSIKPYSVNVKYNNDDLNVNLSFDKSIDSLNATDFMVAGETPNSAHKNSDGSITLVYNDGNPSISTIKLQGLNAAVTTVPQADIKTTDVNGSPIKEITDSQVPYGFTAAPKTYNTNNWVAEDGTDKTVEVKFDTAIDQSSIKKDDFTFAIEGTGTTLKANKVTVSGNTATFTFTNDDNTVASLSKFVNGNSIKVTPKDGTKISTLEDKNDAYGYYTRSHSDEDGYVVNITNDADQADAAREAGNVAPTFNITNGETSKVPTVSTGYTIAVKSSSDETVYNADGDALKVGTSKVIYTVTNTASSKTADTAPITVTVK